MTNKAISIGSDFPMFNKKAVMPSNEFAAISNDVHTASGKWMVMFWWPKDFTFVCPTEIAEFGNNAVEFEKLNTVLIGASTDSEFVHLAWKNNHPDLKNLQFPMLADTSKSLAKDLGILEKSEKIAYRATYIVDPKGIVRWVNINDLSVGRNIDEVLRVLSALQTGELTPCNWKRGEDTLTKKLANA